MKKLLIIIAILALLLSACSTINDTIKLGALLPMSGEAASFGEAVMTGIQLAVDEINSQGGIDGKLLELVIEDDKCGADGAIGATKLTSIDEVDVIIGPVCSSSGGPALPIIQDAKTPAMIIASAPHLTSLGDYIFRVYPSDAFVGSFLANYATNNGYDSVALVSVNNDWGQGIKNSFMEHYKGNIVVNEDMNPGDADARNIVLKIQESNAQLIIMPLYISEALVFVKNVKESGLEIPIIGGDILYSEEFYGNSITEGVRMAVADIGQPEEFMTRAEATGNLVNILTPIGYDAVKLFSQTVKEVGLNNELIKNSLLNTNYQGLSNNIMFDKKGDLSSASYVIYTSIGGEAVMGD